MDIWYWKALVGYNLSGTSIYVDVCTLYESYSVCICIYSRSYSINNCIYKSNVHSHRQYVICMIACDYKYLILHIYNSMCLYLCGDALNHCLQFEGQTAKYPKCPDC